MAVNITFSLLDGGPAITEPLDFGEHGEGLDAPSGVLTSGTIHHIFVRHDSLKTVSDCRLYIGPYSAEFEGIDTPEDNYEELVTQFARHNENGTRMSPPGYTATYPSNPTYVDGLQINLDSENGFPSGSWQQITPVAGDSLSNAFDLGDIPAGQLTGISFQLRFFAPSYGETYATNPRTGLRQWDLKMAYTSRE